MNYISTRSDSISEPLSVAICKGLTEDGGLFVPEYLPTFDLSFFNTGCSFSDFCQEILKHFFLNDLLEAKLSNITKNAFTFPIPLKQLNHNTFVLELFHGPTLSFKDFGARFLAECFDNLSQKNKTTIMVATSGDTGSAVASAFYLKSKVNVIILYPNGRISKKQEHQITCWDDNVLAIPINGSFDLCQDIVKKAFKNAWWQNVMHLNSANSINIARILPQITYYAYTSLQFFSRYQTMPGFVIPTGNLGNATAAYWAKNMGFPIREIVLATNANKVIPNYLLTGNYTPQPSISTLANAMDVGNPSNFERLHYLFNDFNALKKEVKAISASDDDIKTIIKEIYKRYQLIICPHTATAFYARQQLSDKPWIVVSTADPSKFDTAIQRLIDVAIPIPTQLQIMLEKKVNVVKPVSALEEVKAIVTSKRWAEG